MNNSNTGEITGFTPGEWIHDKTFHLYEENKYHQIRGGEGFYDPEAPEAGFYVTGHMSEGTARLIASAPTMQAELIQLKEAARELLHLHSCEQEGLQSGKPTPEMWFNAVNKLSEALYPITPK